MNLLQWYSRPHMREQCNCDWRRHKGQYCSVQSHDLEVHYWALQTNCIQLASIHKYSYWVSRHMTCNILLTYHQNQWATQCKQGFQGQLEEMQVQSHYSSMISRESLQQQESVKHLPSLLPERMSPSNSGPTSAFCRAHTSVLYAYWEFRLDTACAWSSKCSLLFSCLLACRNAWQESNVLCFCDHLLQPSWL